MKRFVIAAFTVCCTMMSFAQGIHWLSTSQGIGGPHTEENFAMPKMIKVVRSGNNGGSSVIIVRLDKNLLWILSPEKKTYSEITFDELAVMAQKGKERMAAMKEKMKDMPEEQRTMMEKMMGGAMDQSIDVKKTGEKKSIAGHSCTKLVALRGGKDFMTMWIADDVKGFKPLIADWRESAERMSSIGSSVLKDMNKIYDSIDGFPMETTVSMMDRSMTTTVSMVEQRTTPETQFEIPDGYSRTTSPMGGAMQRMDGTK